jgi:hypothetical protein
MKRKAKVHVPALFIFFLIGVINYLYRLITALYLWTNDCAGMAGRSDGRCRSNCAPIWRRTEVDYCDYVAQIGNRSGCLETSKVMAPQFTLQFEDGSTVPPSSPTRERRWRSGTEVIRLSTLDNCAVRPLSPTLAALNRKVVLVVVLVVENRIQASQLNAKKIARTSFLGGKAQCIENEDDDEYEDDFAHPS